MKLTEFCKIVHPRMTRREPVRKAFLAGLIVLGGFSTPFLAPASARAAEDAPPIAERLTEADPARGAKAIRKCTICHGIAPGARPRTGPGLHDIVGKPLGAAEGFSYSAALKTRAETGDTWTDEALDAFIANPRAAMPGTLMAFAGINNPRERADIIAYLHSLAQDSAP